MNQKLKNYNPKKTKLWIILLFLLPAFVFMTYSVYIPFFWNLILSFRNWDGFLKDSWVGISNYARAFNDPIVRKSIFNSVFLALVSTIGSVLLGLVLALFIYKVSRREGAFYRLVIFMPVMLPAAIVGLLFTFFFNSEMGILNSFFKLIGLGSLTQAWLEDSSLVMWCISFVNIWKMSGLTMMLTFASMQMLPDSLFESSKLDGATYFQQVSKIILPMIKPTIHISCIYTLVTCFKTYDIVFVMTGGGPGTASYTMPINMIKTAFVFNEYGYSAAMGVIMMIIIILIVSVINKLLKGESYEF